MPFIYDTALDACLDSIRTNATAIHICSSEPTTYAEATSTFSLGSKASPTINAPTDKTGGGREITLGDITDGTTATTGTANFYAVVSGSVLLSTAEITNPQTVTSGNPWTVSGSPAIASVGDAT